VAGRQQLQRSTKLSYQQNEKPQREVETARRKSVPKQSGGGVAGCTGGVTREGLPERRSLQSGCKGHERCYTTKGPMGSGA